MTPSTNPVRSQPRPVPFGIWAGLQSTARRATAARRVCSQQLPDNERAVGRGERQVEGYQRELESITGQVWTAIVDTYRAAGGRR